MSGKLRYKIMLVVGEASGDAHAAKLVESIRKIDSKVKFDFFGATGEKLRKANVETIVEADEFGIVGIFEVVKAIPMFLNVFNKLKKAAKERKPNAVILVDFPEFNLKLAKALKKNGLKVVYYISPQLWAWRKYRIRTIKKYVDLLLTILPFEKDWYFKKGVRHVRYVGLPLVGEVNPSLTRNEFCNKHDLNSSKPIIALLPGSRKKELERILPILVSAACEMNKTSKNLQFVVALARSRNFSEAKKTLENMKRKGLGLPANLRIVHDETYEALNAADAAAVTSGTATLESAIIGTPLVVVYKSSQFDFRVLRPFISVEYVGLVNLIAQKMIAKELIQENLTPENLSAELFSLLDDNINRRTRERLKKIKESLGDGGAARRSAIEILKEIKAHF